MNDSAEGAPFGTRGSGRAARVITRAIGAVHPKYRPDIDGLRALAVLSVLGFHAFPRWLPGGFIGVDVFFVISGFLISTILFENLDRGTFRFTTFYARRVRRIFPTLLLVLMASYAFGWIVLLADEYRQLGKHIAGGAGFVSNYIFWNESGYFDNAADTKPLLHLWSLGIEEQFYIVWPLLLWLACRRRAGFLSITSAAALLSFALNLLTVRADHVAAFYSPQTRAWELFSGALLAWAGIYRPAAAEAIKSKAQRHLASLFDRNGRYSPETILANVLAGSGLLLLGAGFSLIDKASRFPGLWALLPVAGCALIISAGPAGWPNRVILSHRIAVWFGLISFPLYLWHWPLLSFARILDSQTPGRNFRIAALAMSVLLAWLSYRVLERPIRFGRHGGVKVAALSVLMVVVGAAGYVTYSADGLPSRAVARQTSFEGDISHLGYHRYIAEKYPACTPARIAEEALYWEQFIRCNQSKPGPAVDIALVGDSHAEHLFPGLAAALPDRNIAFYIKGTAPFLGNPQFRTIFDVLRTSSSVRTVILTMYWIGRIKEVPAGSTLDRELIKVVDALAASGKQVYLTDDVPSFPFPPQRCKFKRPLSTTGQICEISATTMAEQTAVYLPALEAVARARPAVKILHVGRYFCDGHACSMTRGNEIFFRDETHLNLNGSMYLGARLVEDDADAFR